MSTRWQEFYARQMQDPRLRSLVEQELDHLRLGVQIAKLRRSNRLSQTQLAAKAEMSAPKISMIESKPRNLTVSTLIRVAHALGSRVEIKLVPNRKPRVRQRPVQAA